MGSSGGSATRAAEQAERQRQADIVAAQKRVESIFGSDKRKKEIQDFINANRESLQLGLNRDQERNARQLKFSLAGSGLAGGSVDADQTSDLASAFFDATVDASRRSEGAGANLRSADQSSKLSLFNQIVGGLDTTTAAQNAGAELSQNIGLARNTGTEENFDQFFSRFADIFTASREAKGRRQQQRDFGFGTVYGQTPVNVARVSGGI